jgi:hypothetical protein
VAAKVRWYRGLPFSPALPRDHDDVLRGTEMIHSRIHVSDLREPVGRTVTVRGWVNTLRLQRAMQFVIVRDSTGMVQVNHKRDDGPLEAQLEALTPESAVRITDRVVDAARTTGRGRSSPRSGGSSPRDARPPSQLPAALSSRVIPGYSSPSTRCPARYGARGGARNQETLDGGRRRSPQPGSNPVAVTNRDRHGQPGRVRS